jgi:hypothetical protein
MVVSPAYACHVVVVAKLTAVLAARSCVIGVVTAFGKNHGKVRADRFDKKRQDNNKQTCLNGICVHVKFCESKYRRNWRNGRFGFTGDPPAKRLWLLEL